MYHLYISINSEKKFNFFFHLSAYNIFCSCHSCRLSSYRFFVGFNFDCSNFSFLFEVVFVVFFLIRNRKNKKLRYILIILLFGRI